MKSLSLLSFTMLFAAALASAADPKPAAPQPKREPHPSLVKVEDVPGLPRVLLIGDSISMGYTLDVRKLLEGKANVHRIPTNGGPTTNGVANLKAWLGDSKWDVIHFNWGLHDLKYVLPANRGTIVDLKTAGAVPQVSLADYEKNLATLVAQLKATGAKLIWCSTTPVVAGTPGRLTEDVLKYNEAAARVMKSAGVMTDDLYAYALPRLKDIQLPTNVHYSGPGYRVLAEKVAEVIAAELPKK
jgi:acyl-CoA thioesterase-1